MDCVGRVRRHVRSWRKPTPHSKAHPLVNRLNFALAPLLLALAVHRLALWFAREAADARAVPAHNERRRACWSHQPP
jgi:hypothetical protein